MNKAVLILVIVVVLGVLVFFGLKYFGSSGNGMMSMMNTTAPSNLVVPANSVIIQGNAFNPGTQTVKVGQMITWTNKDGYPHTVTADDGSFDSGSLGSDQNFSFTFIKAGTFSYHCSIHTFMTAKVVVTN